MRMKWKMLAAPVAAVVLMLIMACVAAWVMLHQRIALADLKGIYLEHRRTTNNVRFALTAESGHVFRVVAQIAGFDAKHVEAEHAGLKKRLDEASALLQKIDLPDTRDEEAGIRAALADCLPGMPTTRSTPPLAIRRPASLRWRPSTRSTSAHSTP
jgi:NADPH-dependent curcumin reductase CurA